MQRVQIILEDDIDGSPAVETVQFALDSKRYEIDLTAKHATEFRDSLARFVQAARRTTSRRKATHRAPHVVSAGVDNAAVRAWASSHNIEVSTRGRIPQRVVDAYLADGN